MGHHHSTNRKSGEPQDGKEKEVVFVPPKLEGTSKILNESNIKFLCESLPSEDFAKNWKMLFSSDTNGESWNRFCFHVTGTGPTIILIKDTGNFLFGGFASESWKEKYPKFYGNASSFVFQLAPQQIKYKAVGHNENFQYINYGTKTLFNGIGMGGQFDFFGWVINEDFETGHSRGNPSSTYGNPCLASSPDFKVDYVEVWQVKEPEYSYEVEKINKKKNKTKSVLDEEDNAEKVITGMLGHNFTHYDKEKERHETEINT